MTALQARDETMHTVPESWRRQLFSKWIASNRGEWQNLHDLQYSEARNFAVRKAYLQGNVHAGAVLTGAAVSDACFQVMKREAIANHCVHCRSDVIAS